MVAGPEQGPGGTPVSVERRLQVDTGTGPEGQGHGRVGMWWDLVLRKGPGCWVEEDPGGGTRGCAKVPRTSSEWKKGWPRQPAGRGSTGEGLRWEWDGEAEGDSEVQEGVPGARLKGQGRWSRPWLFRQPESERMDFAKSLEGLGSDPEP